MIIKNIIIKDIISLAKFILLKEDDLNLASLLKSPIIGINESELLELCQTKNQENISLFEALQNSQNIKVKEEHQCRRRASALKEEISTSQESIKFEGEHQCQR